MKRLIITLFSLLVGVLFLQPLDAQIMLRATLDGSQAGTASPAHATMFGQFGSNFRTMSYNITYANLQASFLAAHFHFAPTGAVIHPITFVGNTAKGSWDIPDTLLKYFFKGEIYINIHSDRYPGGEIRGTVIPSQTLFTIALDSTGTGSNSTAMGTGWLWVRPDTVPTLEYDITWAGLSAPYLAMHFHEAPSGIVIHPLSTPDSASTTGTWSNYPDSIISLLFRDRLYVNVHSTAHAGGEIRGFVNPVGVLSFAAAVDGIQSGTGSSGEGTAWAVLDSNFSVFRYSITYAKLEGTYLASHFHTAVDQSVIHPIAFNGETATGTWSGFTDANLQDFVRGRVYVNIHSSVAPGGEISGRMHYYDGIFATTLDGLQAGTGSPAMGTAWAHFGSSTDTLEYRLTFNGLTSPFLASHFHLAPSGVIVLPLSVPDSANSAGAWVPADSILAELVRGNIYVNVHSDAFPGGEIRGTFNGEPSSLAEVQQPTASIPANYRLDQNFPNPFNPTTVITYRIPVKSQVSLKVYDILGRLAATLIEGEQAAGEHQVTFDARLLSSGMYFYRLSAGSFSQIKKMVLLK
jgi:hypothetical protein